ncbi:hypothetical protein ACQRXC_25210 (plasmid) [Niallia taxi]|uniref:hypothetical protein n=1 Tax=Niallia taxi TaxID=2499688 RepID=UPI003F5D97EA
MKAKEHGISIVLNLFLGYLWIIFVNHMVAIANSFHNTLLIGGLFILLGTFLFWEIVNRITPFNTYKFNHPVRITGFASFFLTVVIYFL